MTVSMVQLRQIRLENFDEPHRVKAEPCGTPLSPGYFNCTAAVDKDALCSRERSDHNIHSVCAMLLVDGGGGEGAPGCLLADVRLAGVRALLERCVHEHQRREEHRDALLKELDALLHATKRDDL